MKIFHHNDMDGYGAAHIVKVYKGEQALKDTLNPGEEEITNIFIELDHGKDDEKKFDTVTEGEEVWIVDYSFTEETSKILTMLQDKHCKITWIDHHISSVKLIENHQEFKVIPGIIRDGVSGAKLAYEYCFGSKEKAPMYIELISDYDCWHLKLNPLTDQFKLYYDQLADKWKGLDDVYSHKYDLPYMEECCKIGQYIKNYIDCDNKFYCDQYGYESEFEGIKCFVVNRESNSWIFGEKIKKYPLVVNYAYDGEYYHYSLYADKSFETDCSELAEKHGGGGHKGASGFQAKELLFKKKK